MKEEEVRSLATNTDCKEEARGSPGRSSVSSSQVHDMSVDDRVLEAMVTAGPPLHITPSRRGPSASSTPAKENIGEELRSHTSPDLPSPFCEIGAESDPAGPKARLAQLQQGLAERMRRLVCDRGEGRTGQAMAKLNLALADFQTDTACCLERLTELPGPELETAGEQVAGLVSLLRQANDKLLAVEEATPDASLEGEEDLSSWQLDLEGIQLEERAPLGRRLAQYSLLGAPVPSSPRTGLMARPRLAAAPRRDKLWISLYRGLEELHGQAERSRDLLCLAGDSVREEASLALHCNNNTTPARPARAVACQTEPQEEVEGRCIVTGCFCQSGQEEDQGWVSRACRGGLSVLLLLLLLTFGCGLEVEGRQYWPVTWHLLR